MTYIPPLFPDDADEEDLFHRKYLSVADVFVGTVVDTDTLFCLVWFDPSFPSNDDGFLVIMEAGLSVICLVSDFLVASLSEGCAVDVSSSGFEVVWSASVFTVLIISPILTGFVG